MAWLSRQHSSDALDLHACQNFCWETELVLTTSLLVFCCFLCEQPKQLHIAGKFAEISQWLRGLNSKVVQKRNKCFYDAPIQHEILELQDNSLVTQVSQLFPLYHWFAHGAENFIGLQESNQRNHTHRNGPRPVIPDKLRILPALFELQWSSKQNPHCRKLDKKKSRGCLISEWEESDQIYKVGIPYQLVLRGVNHPS